MASAGVAASPPWRPRWPAPATAGASRRCRRLRSPAAAEDITTLRLGYFPNFTHAPALVGIQEGFFKDALGRARPDRHADDLQRRSRRGHRAVRRRLLDITYIGPNPTVNAYVQSQGDAVRVIAGAASGGAALVVNPDISSPEDLSGKTLRHAAARQHPGRRAAVLAQENRVWPPPKRAATSTIAPQSNSEGLTAFASGQIDGAWVPEPYVSQLRRTRVPRCSWTRRTSGPTASSSPRTSSCGPSSSSSTPTSSTRSSQAHVEALELIEKDPEAAKQDVNDALQGTDRAHRSTPQILDSAWETGRVHRRPAEGHPGRERRTRGRRRSARAGRHRRGRRQLRRPVRPRAAQRRCSRRPAWSRCRPHESTSLLRRVRSRDSGAALARPSGPGCDQGLRPARTRARSRCKTSTSTSLPASSSPSSARPGAARAPC